MAGIKGRCGGAREGAGRKPRDIISDSEITMLVEAARKKAEETGRTIGDVIIDLAHQKEDKRTALAAARLYLDKTIIPESNTNIDNENTLKMPIGPFVIPLI